MSAEKEVVNYWYNKKGLFTVNNIKTNNNRDCGILALKFDNGEANSVFHIEVSCSITNNISETANPEKSVGKIVDEKFDDKSIQSSVNKYIRQFSIPENKIKRIIIVLAIIYAIGTGYLFFKEDYWLLKLLLIINAFSGLALAYVLYRFNVNISKWINLPFLGLIVYPLYQIWYFMTTKSAMMDSRGQFVKMTGYSITATRPYWFLLIAIVFCWIILTIQIKKSSHSSTIK